MPEEGTLVVEAELAPIADESRIVARLRAGDRDAAGMLWTWYADALYREVILPRLPNRELAEDVLRDTFRTVLEKCESYAPEADKSIYFWIRRIAINRAIDVHRAHGRAHKLQGRLQAEADTGPSGSETPPLPSEAEDTRARIEAALGGLNPRYALALRLRLLEDRSRESCAAELAVTVGNFDVILHRACAAFRKVYQPDD